MVKVSTIAKTVVVESASSAHAASFEFFLGDQGSGILSFDNSSITGIGLETVQLSELKNADFFYSYVGIPSSPFPPTAIISGSKTPISFNFNQGELSGIFLESELIYNEVFYPGGSTGVTINGIHSLFLLGGSYEQYFTGTVSVGGFDVNTGEFFEYTDTYTNDLLSSGSIIFKTVEPIPEPLTFLGTGAALCFGTFFKGKLSKNKAALPYL
uniref:PEP-CTERM protein-sorting domain-containing protein n=2 Tax=Gloeothece TaxID=28070 RepID=E0ULI0_GLOV7|nr:hypothetical protein Cyan7822_5959 [Gloeothece verrucosa PCC 7822]